jgi:alanine-glyoxylate transaminase/serine-glyoxylate transaminase/serine-pyruvate transaminase
VFILIGSGSTGLDACIGSAFSSGEKVIVGINGFFGERLGLIANGYNLEVIPVEAEFGQPLRAADFSDALRRHPEARGIILVHLETTTTIINPVPEIGQIARRAGVPYVVDTVSSLGGLPVRMDEWGIDLSASASQKCLGAPPGLSPVAVGPGGWEAIERNPRKGHGWYLNLLTWREYARNWGHFHPFPTTQATSTLRALNVSLQRLQAEGMEARLARYHELALYLRQRLREIGYRLFTPDELMTPVLTAAYGPAGVPTGEVVAFMSERRGIKISAGFGEKLANLIIRIGHMSPTVTRQDLDLVVEGLAAFRPDWRDTPKD